MASGAGGWIGSCESGGSTAFRTVVVISLICSGDRSSGAHNSKMASGGEVTTDVS